MREKRGRSWRRKKKVEEKDAAARRLINLNFGCRCYECR
jgi:hypothetical protein